MIKVIIGLGNPGLRYINTRHNIGFKVIDALVAAHGGGNWRHKDEMDTLEISMNGQAILCIKPQTFMNMSGRVILNLQKRGITPEQILVVHDELEKPFGTLAIKQGGSHKGHNGLRSIIAFCGSDFWRLRFGIGRPTEQKDVPAYVLENFKESPESIEKLITQSVILIEDLLQK